MPTTDPELEVMVDLVASVDRDVVLVEAKASGTFGSKQKRTEHTEKLLGVGRVLRASRIVLATTEPKWTIADETHLSRQAAMETPFPMKVDVVTSL